MGLLHLKGCTPLTPCPPALDLCGAWQPAQLAEGSHGFEFTPFYGTNFRSGERCCLDLAIRACLQLEAVGETCSHTISPAPEGMAAAPWGQAAGSPAPSQTPLSTPCLPSPTSPATQAAPSRSSGPASCGKSNSTGGVGGRGAGSA